MNELRMYVEHLFEGRMLTPETIELKEEIYGNLVARYEDYVAGGMSEAEALAQTKASMTSIEDVIAEQGEDGASKAAGAAPAAASPKGSATATEPATSEETGTDATRVMPAAGATPVPPEEVTQAADEPASAKPARKRWPYVVAAVLAVVVLGTVAVAALNVFDESKNTVSTNAASAVVSADDGATDQTDAATTDDSSTSTDATGSNASTGTSDTAASGTSGLSTDALAYDVYVDSNGTVYYDGDRADDIITAIVGSSHSHVSTYAGTSLSDTTTVEAFVQSLPMGSWATSVDVTSRTGVLSYVYQGVPKRYDDDSVEAALAYNATAIFCAMSDVSSIAVRVSESDDPYDYDYYVFDRSTVENLYGFALNEDLLTETGWTQVKNDTLYTHHFIENLVECAEHS